MDRDFEGKRFAVTEDEVATVVSPTGELSPRERTVLSAAIAGQHDKLIAYELGVAHSTVRVLIFRAIRKLGAKNRPEALARFRAQA